MWKQMRQKLHSAHLGRLCRRTVALSLALSMIMPLFASAFDSLEMPTEVTDPQEFPTITVEANAVVDRWYDPDGPESPADYLTGYLEVAIRVKSGVKDGKLQDFNTVSLALKYSPLLTPYDWTVQKGWSEETVNKDADGNEIVQPVNLAGTSGFGEMTSIQTLKNNRITTAVGHVSASEEENVGGYLYIMANADRPVTLTEDTVLAVVRFKYNLEDDEDAGIEGIKPVATDVDKWVNPDNTDTCLIQFATPDELGEDYIQPEVYYDSADNGMYYTTAKDPDVDDRRREAKKADGSGDTDKDANCIPLSTDYTQIEANKINFTLVNKTTYNDGGLSLDDLATVLFYDWDDTLIGVLIVPKDGDARKLVNDYVAKTFIHPDLRADKTTGANTNYASLARTDSYRGKYPSSEPKAEGVTDGTEDPNGGAYPLTNKLDYTFVKRPMERVTEDESGNPVTENLWRQKETEDGLGAWDDNYPYIHGWAKLPDKDWNNPSAVWTTIGAGELSSFTGLNSGAYENISDITTGSAELVSTAENFKFADFNFRKSNNNSLKAGSVYAVKAVYEPGQELMNVETSYRMISQPYYNKMNYPSALNGAAYSVDIIFERASTSLGPVRGVTRIRQPDIRQDTTTDIRWEDQYLNNANVEEEIGKGKSSYTNVVVDNADEVEIRLVLSARQNKVDYYLIDSFNSSFVTGGARSSTNFEYVDEEHVIDNYNYKTNTSDVTVDKVSVDYYDAPYEDRDGSHGFVLYGTLNNMAQKLTEDYNGALSTLDFNNFISVDNMNDINLRSYSNEKPKLQTATSFRNALRAATAEAAKRHDPDDTDYPGTDNRAWDVEHGYAQFSYHQLQLFVSDYLDPDVTTPTLRTVEDADKVTIKWCHLHENCAAEASGKPRSWEQLVATAQRTDKTRNEKIELIRLLSLDEQKAMTHLRADGDGTHFANNRAFAIAWLDAVEAGNTTWDTIQDYIVRKEDDASYAQKTYWWYDDDKATRVTFNSLTDTVAAVQDLIYPKTVPGETTPVPRSAKLNQLKSAFDANADSDAVDTSWNRATKNLAITRDGKEAQKFKNWDEFVDYFSKAVKAAQDAGVKLEFADDDDADAIAKKTRAYWEKLQYHILSRENVLTNTGIYPVTPTTEQQGEMDEYWWYDGAVKVTNLATLILAAQDANSGKPASMDMFKYSALYDADNKELHFARNFQGEKYTSANDEDTENNDYLVFSEFKEAIMDYVQADRTWLRSNDPDWDRVQYYLIHARIDKATALNSVDSYGDYEAEYYWWKEGKAAQPVDFTLGGSANDGNPGARADALAVALMDAAFRATYNGNTVAWDDLTTDVVESGRLVKGSTGSEGAFPGDFTMFSDVSDVEAVVIALMKRINGDPSVAPGDVPPLPAPKATWHQIQYYTLEKNYAGDTWITRNRNYWWKEKDSNGKTAAVLFGELRAYLGRIASGDNAALQELRDWYDEDTAEKLEFTPDGVELVDKDLWDSVPWDELATMGDISTATWAQIEFVFFYYVAGEEWYFIDDDSEAQDILIENEIPVSPPSGSWTPASVSTFSMRKAPREMVNIPKTIEGISARMTLLRSAIQKDPSKIEEYMEELNQLLEEMEELKALINGAEENDPAETTTADNMDDASSEDASVEEPDDPDDEDPVGDGVPTVPSNDDDPVGDGVPTVPSNDEDSVGDGVLTVPPVGLDDLGGLTDTASNKAASVKSDDPTPVEPDDPGRLDFDTLEADTPPLTAWARTTLSAPLTTTVLRRLTSGEKQQLITIENTSVYNNRLLLSRAGPPLRSPALSPIRFDFSGLTSERRLAA